MISRCGYSHQQQTIEFREVQCGNKFISRMVCDFNDLKGSTACLCQLCGRILKDASKCAEAGDKRAFFHLMRRGLQLRSTASNGAYKKGCGCSTIPLHDMPASIKKRAGDLGLADLEEFGKVISREERIRSAGRTKVQPQFDEKLATNFLPVKADVRRSSELQGSSLCPPKPCLPNLTWIT